MAVLLVADDFGRLAADAERLGTGLYGLLIAKVAIRDVKGILVGDHGTGHVKLYRSRGRGYSKVSDYRLKLTKRRALYPDEEEPPAEPELFTIGSSPPIHTIQKEGRKGGRAERATPAPPRKEL